MLHQHTHIHTCKSILKSITHLLVMVANMCDKSVTNSHIIKVTRPNLIQIEPWTNYFQPSWFTPMFLFSWLTPNDSPQLNLIKVCVTLSIAFKHFHWLNLYFFFFKFLLLNKPQEFNADDKEIALTSCVITCNKILTQRKIKFLPAGKFVLIAEKLQNITGKIV